MVEAATAIDPVFVVVGGSGSSEQQIRPDPATEAARKKRQIENPARRENSNQGSRGVALSPSA